MNPVEIAYQDKAAKGELEIDPVQLALSKRLDELLEEISAKRLASKSSSLGWFFGKREKAKPIKGLYIWGSVGRGKSMLMDLFFCLAKVELKRRAHFHDFMADAQERIHQYRQAFKRGEVKEEDPIPPVARKLASEAKLLCFDEFSVTDIADAMILGRLFKGLYAEGTVIVATSNVAPDSLYKDGLNRQRFLPFIELLKAHSEIFELDARTDYRLEKLAKAPVYIAPLGEKAKRLMDAAWSCMAGGQEGHADHLTVKGRKIHVPLAHDGVARFEFSDLCEKPLGSQDYLAIARRYHTIFLDNVPLMSLAQRNSAKRFINLIDTLYDQRIRLVISAATNPHALYQAESGVEAFEFQRTASRLIEMQSEDYLAGHPSESAI